jgi:mono/diheme cytochrome c family protein
MRVIVTIVAVFVVLAAILLAVLYTGAYNVAADAPHTHLVRWALSTTMDNSVERQAAGIQAPDLSDPAMLARGAAHYKENCEICHVGPGVEESEIHKGLNPHAPELVRSVGDLSAAEVFWITKHGVKMTGMPTFGRTHTDQEIWDIVAFVKALPKMSPARYAELTAGAEEHHHEGTDEDMGSDGDESHEMDHGTGGTEAGGH